MTKEEIKQAFEIIRTRSDWSRFYTQEQFEEVIDYVFDTELKGE
jgi:hypothetical protein